MYAALVLCCVLVFVFCVLLDNVGGRTRTRCMDLLQLALAASTHNVADISGLPATSYLRISHSCLKNFAQPLRCRRPRLHYFPSSCWMAIRALQLVAVRGVKIFDERVLSCYDVKQDTIFLSDGNLWAGKGKTAGTAKFPQSPDRCGKKHFHVTGSAWEI